MSKPTELCKHDGSRPYAMFEFGYTPILVMFCIMCESYHEIEGRFMHNPATGAFLERITVEERDALQANEALRSVFSSCRTVPAQSAVQEPQPKVNKDVV